MNKKTQKTVWIVLVVIMVLSTVIYLIKPAF